MLTLAQYTDDPELAAEMIADQIRENLGQQGVSTAQKAGLVDMLVRFEIINLELSRLHHRVLELEASHASN